MQLAYVQPSVHYIILIKLNRLVQNMGELYRNASDIIAMLPAAQALVNNISLRTTVLVDFQLLPI